MEENYLLKPENYWDGYQDKIDALKNKPEIIEFDRLCYDIFEHNETGRNFIKLIEKRYLIPSLSGRGAATYQIDVLWEAGFKDAFRMIMNSVQSHKNRIKAEMK